MINENNIEEYYNDYAYNNYYKETDWDEYNEAMAEKSDTDYEDRIFEEED